MKSFNLSEWALAHRSFVWFLMIVAALAGFMAYRGLGREEDPPFTIKTMVIVQTWPGATVDEMLNEVTDRIEKELKQIDALDYTKSYTVPGRTTIFVNLKDTTKPKDVGWDFYQVRKHVQDIQGTLPNGVQPPAFNDQFGDVYGKIYAFTADGLTQRQLRDYVEQVRSDIMSVPNIGKVIEIGAQDEVIYLDFSVRKVAALGLNAQTIIKTLQDQNAVQPSGVVQAGPRRSRCRSAASSLRKRAYARSTCASTIASSPSATSPRSHAATRTHSIRYSVSTANRRWADIGMKPSANLLQFGEDLKAKMREIEANLPVGIGIHLVSDQPRVVEEAVGGFTEALVEAVAIVLGVSFLSLGLRAGLVVSCSIPLVLALVFVGMNALGISMQRISLGALIIALGLLVDDAMMTVEMMVSRLEHGDKLEDAAAFAYKSTAFPMLTGTLVTVAGFIPIGLNSSLAGEYTFSLFVVIALALLLSWVVAVLFAPLIGVVLLPRKVKRHTGEKGHGAKIFAAMLLAAKRWRWVTITVCLGLLVASIVGLGHVEQQFFPSSDRPELLVDMTLPQNSAIAETKAQMDRLEAILAADPDVASWSSYVGQGAIRFESPN